MVCVAAVALGSSTYAWFVSNNTVKATTTTISAQSNAPFLKIDKDSLTESSTTVATRADESSVALYPASSDDMKSWYICQNWDNQGLVTDYSVPFKE